MGNLLAAQVHAANIHDTKSGIGAFSLACWKYPTIVAGCGDAGYRGTFVDSAQELLGRRIDISEKIKPEWEILPKRWVVERTFSWLNHSRRLSKDYEITTDSELNFLYISHLHTLLRRLLPVA
jgi:hypothetical protein